MVERLAEKFLDHLTAIFLIVFGVLAAGGAGHGVELQSVIVGAGVALLTQAEKTRRRGDG